MKAVITAAATIWILMVFESVLRPFAISLLIWLVFSAASERLLRLVPARWRGGKATARAISAVAIAIMLLAVGALVAQNAETLVNNYDLYKDNLEFLLEEAQKLLGLPIDKITHLGDLLSRVDVRSVAVSLAGSTAAYGSAFLVVLIYLIFIAAETSSFRRKLAALPQNETEAEHLRAFATSLKRAIDDVLGVQVLVGALQAVPTYIVLVLVGVDGAMLWAVLVFLFSFIPTIGTLFGIAVPSLMTLLQFMSLQSFLLVFVVIGAIQVVGTNIVLPRMMSRSLNLSSLAVLLAVFAGGALWGISGALIAVPALTIALIICTQVPSLRRAAILLSADGELPPKSADGAADDGPSREAKVEPR